MSSYLALYLLGPAELYLDDTLIFVERRKAVALLAYLAIEQRQHRRESLSALLWPDYDQPKAFTNLRHTLWEIQQFIGEGWLLTDREKIALNKNADIWLDVRQFEALLTQSHAQNDRSLRIPLLVESTKLYRNHFLSGFNLKDAPNFNEWMFAKSEDLRCQFAGVLTGLSEDYCVLGQPEKAVPYARRLITLDPLNESAHRRLMEVYVQAGQHSAALKQYQICEDILRRELNLDPQPETFALYKKIRKREIKPVQETKPKEPVSPRHNLPLQLSSFIGREKEQKEIADLIANHRLVTLTGAGGIGKTRLSIQVAFALLNNFPNGSWLMELAPLSDPMLVPQVIITALGLTEKVGVSPRNILTDFLQRKRILLILDNCEHLIEACAQLAETLLHACPDLHILTTSREALSIAGEMLYRVPSLTTPDPMHVTIDTLSNYESVQLFVERAQLMQQDFSLTTENASSVTQICRRLDGIPLAIELAAARVNMLSMDQIAAQLKDCFSLLTARNRTSLPRQQTIRASIDWSWNLLTDAEQLLLRRLSVFAGGWTLEAAEFVCRDSEADSFSVLNCMTQLAAKSLINGKAKADSPTRYSMLETVRDYAFEKLKLSSETEAVCLRHLIFFGKIVEEAERNFKSPHQALSYERLDHELDNLRAALCWFDGSEHAELRLELAAKLWRYWISRGYSTEGRSHLRSILTCWLPGLPPETFTYARALEAAGALAYNAGDLNDAEQNHQAALQIFRKLDDKDGIADSIMGLGNTALSLGNYDKARQLYAECLVLRQSLGDKRGIARLLGNLGLLAYFEIDYPKAHALYLESLNLFRELKDSAGTAFILDNLGDVVRHQGDLSSALSFYEESITIRSRWKGEFGSASAILGIADIAFEQGDVAKAAQFYRQCLLLFQKASDIIGLSSVLESIAALALTKSQWENAARIFGAVEKLCENTSAPLPPPDQHAHKENLSKLQEQLTPSIFKKAWSEGQRMTIDEMVAVAYALTEY